MSIQPDRSSFRGKALATLTILAGAAAFALLVGVIDLQGRLDTVESAREAQVQTLRTNLSQVQAEVQSLHADLDSAGDKAEQAVSLSERLRSAESRLGDIGQAIEAHASSLSALEKEREAFGPKTLEQELAAHDELIQDRWDSFSKVLTSVQDMADESRKRVEKLDSVLSAQRDLSRMWHEIVGPVVQLAGETSVGSGVLLASAQQPEESGLYLTHLLTAWHVVRDIQGDLSKTDAPVPVTIYVADGSTRHETAHLLRFDPELDAALLEVRTEDRLCDGARLASKERLASVRIFDPVYAVGCPLGNDPIPTFGEVATVHHVVDGQSYWMINAPTYIGNSGGGIFDSQTHELLGIFSKIYTHGAVRPTIVPHMGLVTPLGRVYEWLEQSGYATLVPEKAVAPGSEAGVTAANY